MASFSPASNKKTAKAIYLREKHDQFKTSEFDRFKMMIGDSLKDQCKPSLKPHTLKETLKLLKDYSKSNDLQEPSLDEQEVLAILVGAPKQGVGWPQHLQEKQALLQHCREALKGFAALSPKARGEAIAKQVYYYDYFLKPLKECMNAVNNNSISDNHKEFLQQCLQVREAANKDPKNLYQASKEKAMKGFLRDGVFEARSEKWIPGYLAGMGITLLALGRVVLAALPVGQLVLSAYSAGNMVMAARDCKHSFAKLKAIRAKLAADDGSSAPRLQALCAVEQHYTKMRRWAMAGTAAWAVNTVGMLAMTAVSSAKWVAALLAAPFSLGLSIPAGVVTGSLLGWMSLTMFGATASVAGAAFVAVPANLKLRGRTYTPLKPPKAWEKLPHERGKEVLKGHKTFTQDEVERQLINNTHQHGVVRAYREQFFSALSKRDQHKIQARRWGARLVMWGSLGALSGVALRMKFNNKVAAARCLTPDPQNWQVLYNALKVLKIQPEVQAEDLTPAEIRSKEEAVALAATAFEGTLKPEQFSAYMEQIKNLPCIGDIAKILARSLTVHSKNTLETLGGEVITIRSSQLQSVFNGYALKAMGYETMAVSPKAKKFLSIATELAKYGPCCDTTADGKRLLNTLRKLGEKNADLQPFLRNVVYQASAQYLVYQRRKEIKEERAEWSELYMHLEAQAGSALPENAQLAN